MPEGTKTSPSGANYKIKSLAELSLPSQSSQCSLKNFFYERVPLLRISYRMASPLLNKHPTILSISINKTVNCFDKHKSNISSNILASSIKFFFFIVKMKKIILHLLVNTRLHAQKRAYIHTHKYTHTHTHKYSLKHTHTYIHTNTRTNIHSNKHTFT